MAYMVLGRPGLLRNGYSQSAPSDFLNLQAWPVGYALLMKNLCHGGGHLPDMADKVEQIDPGETGCSYADEELLKSIRVHGRFVDQEIA